MMNSVRWAVGDGRWGSLWSMVHGPWPVVWTLLALLLLVWPSTLAAQSEGLTLDEYWATLELLLPQIEALDDLPAPEQAAARADLVEQLDGLTAVSLPDGQIIPVSQEHLQSLLADLDSDPARIASYLQNQLESREQWPPAVVDQLDEATLQAILSRPEFQYEVREPTWWERTWERIQLWFWERVTRFAPGAAVGDWLTVIILVFSGLILGLILFYVLRRLRADFAAEARFDLGDDPHLDNITADTAWQRAQESSNEGDYRQAVRYLYLSTLLLLEERDLLRYDRTLTNREYLSRLAHRPDLAAILREVVDVFDRVWYGYQPLSEGEYGRFADRVQTLKQQKGGRP
jgi:hypothetical protein